jgi:hypothetical protein
MLGSVFFENPNSSIFASKSKFPTALTTDGMLDGSGVGPGKTGSSDTSPSSFTPDAHTT